VEEVARAEHRIADDVDVGQPGEQFTESRRELSAGQLVAQAVMDTAAAEGYVLVG